LGFNLLDDFTKQLMVLRMLNGGFEERVHIDFPSGVVGSLDGEVWPGVCGDMIYQRIADERSVVIYQSGGSAQCMIYHCTFL
jgi:hypothetical protein